MKNLVLLLCFFPIFALAQNSIQADLNSDLQSLAKEFFEWRKITQPATGDDILRVERPDKWAPDYSPKAVINYKQEYEKYINRLASLNKSNFSLADSVDYLLLRSAIERVNWELNILKQPFRNPDFYVHQTIGAVYELLLVHSEMTDERAENIITRLNSIPTTIKHAKQNLNEPVKAFTEIALEKLNDIRNRLYQMRDGLKLLMDKSHFAELDKAVENAADALEDYSYYLDELLPPTTESFSIGRENYEYFLKNIALIPHTPEEMLIMGEQEWNRSVAFDIFEKERNADLPEVEIFSSADEQIEQALKDEKAIRKFLVDKNIMSVPDWTKHYINKKLPPHIAPFTNMGVLDDLTSEERLDEDGVRYIVEPSWNMGFFSLSMAKDPRPIIIHEGIPGHYFQLILSWANPDLVRRRFIDSGPIEGIGFYVEELLHQYGLFNDRPRTREIIYSYMRLRALRVDVDINLALGNYTIEQAGKYLAETVPMDLETGIHEAGFFAYNPGQAITYQIGKLQILDLIADGKVLLGDKFNLKDYHDYMMENGNVPIALQRWEYLGLRDEIETLWVEQKD